jgi:hypothetical protein
MAVLALVGAALAFAAPGASADEGKVWICHADVNGTNGPGGPQSDKDNPNGQPNLGQGGFGGEDQIGFNLIEIAVSAWENAHLKLHPADFPAFEKNGVYSCTEFANVPETYPAKKTATATFCWEGVVTTVTAEGTDSYTTVDGPVPVETKAAVDVSAQKKADDALAALLGSTYAARTPVPADQICPVTPPTEPVTQPEAATAVEAATVANPEPATVPIPTAVTLPAKIPAGDPAPTVPAYVLALLALGATALAASTVRLVRTTR